MNKDKTVAGILAILLGTLGVHKFYLGNTTAGIVYLLVTLISCGTLATVLQIVCLVEGIMMLTESEEKFADRVANKPFFL